MKPFICKCCGQPFESEEVSNSPNPNVCFSCASLFDDVQDKMIIDSAMPLEARTPPPSTEAEAEAPAECDWDQAGASSAEPAHPQPARKR